MKTFKGEQHHSSSHPGPDGYKGKKVVVIGSNNSAHDICAALVEQGIDATMVQRSSTHIVRSDTLMEIGLGDLYSERAVRAGMISQWTALGLSIVQLLSPILLLLCVGDAARADCIVENDHTIAAAYSVRPTPDARVSTPLSWSKVADVDPADYTVETLRDYVAAEGDPFRGMWRRAVSLRPRFRRLGLEPPD